jgi:hypothetical protein
VINKVPFLCQKKKQHKEQERQGSHSKKKPWRHLIDGKTHHGASTAITRKSKQDVPAGGITQLDATPE